MWKNEDGLYLYFSKHFKQKFKKSVLDNCMEYRVGQDLWGQITQSFYFYFFL